nr:calcium-binding protein [uncultured Cohaesibacter sp.]
MAQVTYYEAASDRDIVVDAMDDGTVITMNSTTISIYNTDGTILTLTGSGITYQYVDGEKDVTGGTITSIELTTADGETIISISDFSYDLLPFITAMNEVDWDASAFDCDTSFNYLYTQILSGADTIDASDAIGTETNPIVLHGEVGADTITGGDGVDLIYGYTGNDTIDGGSGNDTIYGGAGSDIIDGGDGDDILYGGAGNDTLYAGSGEDELYGGAGNDTFYVQTVSSDDDDNLIVTGTGNDTIILENEAAYVTLDYSSFGSAIDADLSAGTITATNKTDTIQFNGGDVDRIYGTAYDDTITADDQGVMMIGLDGSDTFIGGAGEDTVFYYYDYFNGGTSAVTVNLATGTATDGWGNTDTLSSIDTVRGSILDDTFIGSDADETFLGLAGNDTIDGGAGFDIIDYHRDTYYSDVDDETGSSGVTVNLATGTATDGYGDTDTFTNIEGAKGTSYDDTLIGSSVANTLVGKAGNDTLSGAAGNDTLNGGDGNDILKGGSGVDTMTGGAGNDVYYVDNAKDSITELSGEGTDLVYSYASYNLRNNSQFIEKITLLGSGNINATGNMQANTMRGNSGANHLNGLAGADVISGLGGNDTLNGGDGNDTLYGNLGNDTLNGNTGIDKLFGGDGSDTLNGGVGNDILNGGAGDDILHGNQNNDTLNGNDGVDKLFGDLGNDTLFGGAGNDILNGGTGNDILHGNQNNDTLNGNDGVDKLFGDLGNDTLFGGAGNDILNGGAGNDILHGNQNNDTLYGGAGTDKLFGELGNDKLFGGAGNDILNGGVGNDTLNGGDGNDTLYAGAGSDILNGGAGTDSMYAGNDNAVDTFVFTSVSDSSASGDHDMLYAFDSGEDVIDLSGIDASSTTAANDSFTFAGTSAEANAVWYETSGSDLLVYADTNGDAIADFEIQLVHTSSVTEADFIL